MKQLVTVMLDDRTLGIDVLLVQDVIRLAPLTPVPLAPSWIAGVMNLRGHIVTAIDLRERLGMPSAAEEKGRMCVVVNGGTEPYALIVDAVGDVMDIDDGEIERDPPTLAPAWRDVSRGIIRRDVLILRLDISRLVNPGAAQAA